MGTIMDDMVKVVQYQHNMGVLSASTKPTEDQVTGWVNDAIRDIVMHLIPRRMEAGRITTGRLDKLSKITEVITLSAATGTASLPTTLEIYVAFTSILIGTVGSPTPNVLYHAQEITYDELLDRSLRSDYLPPATEPVYAFGDGKLYYLPVTGPDRVEYHYLELPALLTSSGDWPLDEDLIPLGNFYVLAESWAQVGSDLAKSQMFRSLYEAGIEMLTGQTYQTIEEWGR